MDKLKTLSYLITEENITVNNLGRTYTVNKNNNKVLYERIKSRIKDKKFDEVIDELFPAKAVMQYVTEYFVVNENGTIYLKDRPNEYIPTAIGKRLILFAKDKLDIEPLVNFWKKLRENPSNDSKEDLYKFLEVNHHPITPEGNFIAYKKITKKGSGYVDSHTKTINNSIGQIVSMSRSAVNPSRNDTCSAGLHVAAFEYAKNFDGDTLVEVLIDPADVVAVPIDYKNQKMRVCKYKVMGYVETDNKTNLPKEREEILALIKDEKGMEFKPKVEIKKTPEKFSKGKADLKTFSFDGLTAREIVASVKNIAKINIAPYEDDLKNKQSIIKKARAILTKEGYHIL